ncbi:adenine specific DNA methyltransferase [Sulfuriferula multivorans]|uniref:site-specific DNA-methyltransferase (adenine-specific) n=1 Tax=Sulfuriferula multivorans TaxID=1559896 RepID=A0A401JAI5_9PROT|nr:type ISP restriction/modification enzyme [Sulfuriferula multivorans]GBL44570.1 adenine specific DNA methyltransferase [Sulfuriferula multivorans]
MLQTKKGGNKVVDYTIFKDYLALIEKAYKAGNATEHTHRPALKDLLEAFQPGVTATNEPKRIKCGAPDYIITRKDIPLGFVEAKDIGVSLDDTENSEQLKRYREGLANLILTDYLEFRWYVSGELRLTVRLAKPQTNGKLRAEADGAQQLAELLQSFFAENIPVISSPKELATRMAALARLIRSIIGKTFAEEDEYGTLHEQMDGFRKVLLHDLDAEQFGDMYAQTICYGLFAARCNSTGAHFTRTHAAYDLPKTNPFLRKLFAHIAGPELDERIVWVVDNLAELLNRADIAAILQDFGRATRQEDPVVHFYETFLGAYDQKMREARGVYYTPEPVVSYIVRSVDAILKKDFKLSAGLADSSKVKLTRPKQRGKGTETIETHKVQILDPATGTGTFLYSVIGQIYQTFAGNKGMWPSYVQENLLPRVYGFELLMAPYAVAHMKLGLLLRETGYDFSSDERLRVFLTNTLEEAHEMTGLPLFTQWLADEATSANLVKKETPVMVVLGNPPYSGHSANTGEWIAGLLRGIDSTTGQKTGNYFEVDGAPLGERNPKWLNNDYVKFIRFAQWRIEQTGYGVLAFVTDNSYLTSPTFRGMRQSLMQSFDDIYLLDLHGNSNKKETALDSSKDENVFDIRQGVTIGLFVKRSKVQDKGAQVFHADLYGTRASKYAGLAENDMTTTHWQALKPQAPFYLFVPQDDTVRAEYEQGWVITDIMPVNSVGIVTARDALTIHWSREDIWRTVNDFAHLPVEDAREKYDLGKDSQDWKIAWAQTDLKESGLSDGKLASVLYRPFDSRYTYYTGKPSGFHCRPCGEVMRQMQDGKNLGFATTRSTEIGRGWEHLFCTNGLLTHHTVSIKEVNYLFPLYLNSAAKTDLFDNSVVGGRRPNLAPEFIAEFAMRLQLDFVPDGCGDLKKTFGPEDVFHYAYAVFYSPTYRSRYAEFLKRDFPRLPLTRDVALFRSLCALGKELVALHLMEQLPKLETRYPEAGDNTVDAVRYTEPASGVPGRVWINQKQYFDNVPPEVWNYHIGGYQVCQKWLKDRKERQLSYDDLTHYRGIVAALARTIELQAAIDDSISEWPLQ